MKLHFTPEWLRRRIEDDGDDAECEAGPDIIETLDLLVRVANTNHPDAAIAIAGASILRQHLRASKGTSHG